MTEYPVKAIKFKHLSASELGSQKSIRSGEPVYRIGIPTGTKFEVALVPELGGVLVRGGHRGNVFYYHASLLDEIVYSDADEAEAVPEIELGKKAAAK